MISPCAIIQPWTLSACPRAQASCTNTSEAIEACEFDLELESRTAALATCERHQQAGLQTVAYGCVDLFADEVDGLLTVDRQ
jgi:hypothetical protein